MTGDGMTPRVRTTRARWMAAGARRGTVVALVAALAVAVLVHRAPAGDGGAADVRAAARQDATYTPVTGAIFNRPVGTKYQQSAIFRHVNQSIDSAPSGSTIRMAVYSFAQASTADKLVKAYKRGVKVQLIF